MNQALATVFLICVLFLLALGNFWFTFGIWPHSWWSFFGFSFASVLVHLVLTLVGRSTE